MSKRLQRVLFVALMGLILVIFTGLIARVLQDLVDRRTEYNYFYEALDVLPETKAIVTWSGNRPLGREVTLRDESDFSIKITEAWQALAMGLDTENENNLRDYFTGTALERALHVLRSPEAEGSNTVLMGIEVDPLVYHLDGALLHFQSDKAVFARYLIEDDKLAAYSLSEDCILSQMINEQSGWKVTKFERECSKPLSLVSQSPEWDLPKLKGINYYPKNSPWTYFWQNYSPYVVERDLKTMQSMGVNSVRIFLPKSIFSDPDFSKEALENLGDFLMKCEMLNLFVIPTLFDFRGELTPWSWSSDRYYLDQVLPVLNKHPNIAFVDIKNELDLDSRFQSWALIEAWVRTIMGVSRQIAPNLRYSIGWSDAEHAMHFAELFDVISYHEYGPAEGRAARLDAVKKQAGEKPVIISEVGATSYDFHFGLPSNLDKQAQNLEAVLNDVSSSDGVLIWTLYDYPTLDPKAVTGSFWHKGIQKNFGLIDRNENAKPASEIFTKWNFQNDQ